MIDGSLIIYDNETETQPFLSLDSQEKRLPNPLPELQFAIVLLLQVCEPITSQSIYPYINEVSFFSSQIERPLLIIFDSLLLGLISLEVTTVRSGTMLDYLLSGNESQLNSMIIKQ